MPPFLQPSIRILLIDDHTVMRAGLRLLIESSPGMVVVGEAENRQQALVLAAREQPDVLLLDLALGEESGLDVLSDLLKTSQGARVLILTASRDAVEHERAVALGATGIVLKDQAMDVLLNAIRHVHAGESWLERSIVDRVLTQFSPTAAGKKTEPEAVKIDLLTESERKIIALLCQGLTNKQLAQRLCISESTVHNHLTAIFHKLDVSNRLGLVIYAFRHNLAAPQ